jgi:hypothetical protein
MSTPKAISLRAKTVFINVITDSVSRVAREGSLEYQLVDPSEPTPLEAAQIDIYIEQGVYEKGGECWEVLNDVLRIMDKHIEAQE